MRVREVVLPPEQSGERQLVGLVGLVAGNARIISGHECELATEVDLRFGAEAAGEAGREAGCNAAGFFAALEDARGRAVGLAVAVAVPVRARGGKSAEHRRLITVVPPAR